MLNKIMTTQPVVGSPAASPTNETQTPKAALATAKDPRRKGDNDSSAAFAAAMLVAGQQQPQSPQQTAGIKYPQVSDSNGGKVVEDPNASKVASGPAITAPETKTLDTKSLSEQSGLMAASLMKAKTASESAGANAGAMKAGLQPQPSMGALPTQSSAKALLEGTRSMKEWVFDGVEGNPNLRTLFGAQAGENLLNKIQTGPQQARGEVAASTQSMTSTQQQAQSNDDLLPEIPGQAGMIPGHAIVERPQPQLAHSGGSSALSGAEYLSTLSALRGAAQGAAAQGEGGQGSLGREGQKAGFQGGPSSGEIKKSRLGSTNESDFDTLAAGGSSTVSSSAVLNGTRADVTAKPDGGANVMQAHVTTGSMSQDRIASASVYGMSASIRDMASRGQGGEMRIKLHPENLGELHLRVVTDGKQVGLQIQASDDKARKILEQSLSDLKDSLSKHQLSLAQVEFAVGQPQGAFSSDLGSDSKQGSSQNAFGGMQDMMNNRGGGQSGSWNGAQEGASARESWTSSPLRTAMPGRAAAQMASASSRSAASGDNRRLDVRA